MAAGSTQPGEMLSVGLRSWQANRTDAPEEAFPLPAQA